MKNLIEGLGVHMFFFSSPIDRAANRYVRARFRVSEAERQERGLEEAHAELQRAEASWQAACSATRNIARPTLVQKLLPPRRLKQPVPVRQKSNVR